MIGCVRLTAAACALLLVAAGCESESAPSSEETGSVVVNPGEMVAQPGQLPPGGAGASAPMPMAGPDSATEEPDALAPAVAGMPCDVASVVADNCQQCHGENPIGGAIPLVTHEDWHQPSPLYDPTKQVYEVAQLRINNGEMPQGGTMSATDLATLDAWLASGALAAGPEQGICATPEDPDTDAVEQPAGPVETIDSCKKPHAFDPPRTVAGPEETCYDFQVTARGGNGKFTVPTNESYHEWYYAVPWPAGHVWTRYGADFDNLEVLHHYLVFTSNAAQSPGSLVTNVTGTTLGTGATLIGGWAVGGCSTSLTPEAGGEIPPSALIMIQWHMYNSTGLPAQDGSTVQICTVPPGTRPNTAGITFLGTENFFGPAGMPPGENDFTTQCTNFSNGPITVVGFNPHMHLLGTHMKTDLRRADGTTTTIFDQPFQFDYQVGYEIPHVDVMPGDTLVTTCSFFNDTGSNVAFGESTGQEMCYQFALSYPAGALNNGALSLIGALNTCW